MYFAIQLRSEYEEVPQLVDFSFELEYFLTGFVWYSGLAGIDIAALLAGHEASFVTEGPYVDVDGEEWVQEYLLLNERWGFRSHRLDEIMGEDFNPLSYDFEILAMNELNVQIADGHYITNIALTDDVLLRIQFTEPPHMAVRPGMGWTSVQLVDARLQALQEALWEDWDAAWIAWIEAGYAWEDFDESELVERANELDEAHVQELFSVNLTRWWDMDAPVVVEIGYLVEDLDLLNHLDFMVHSSYYETQDPIPFGFSGSTQVLDFGAVEFSGTHSVFVHDRYLNVTDVRVGFTGISFSVQDTAFFPDLDAESVNVFDLFEIEFIMVDGEVRRDLWFGGAMWAWPYEGDELSVSSFEFDFFTDTRQLVGVRINGTEIR